MAQTVESDCSPGDPGLRPGSGRSPEKEMTTYSSILAWRIPWAEETVHGVTRVGPDLATKPPPLVYLLLFFLDCTTLLMGSYFPNQD